MWTRQRDGKDRFGCYGHGSWCWMIWNLHWNRNWNLYLFLTNMSDLLLTLLFIKFLLDRFM